LIVDIGAQGRRSDGGIFKNSVMGFYNNNMYLPAPSAISARHQVSYVIVAGEATKFIYYATISNKKFNESSIEFLILD